MKVKDIVVLEALRKTRSRVPLPISGQWSALKEPIKSLFSAGYLEMKDSEFIISAEGKKTLLLFNDTRKELIEPFDEYKKISVEGNTIDARIPLAAFRVKGQISEETAADYLENLNVFLMWENFFDYIKYLNKEGQDWQSQLLSSFELQTKYNTGVDSWKRLGRTPEAASIQAAKILTPETLVQIQT